MALKEMLQTKRDELGTLATTATALRDEFPDGFGDNTEKATEFKSAVESAVTLQGEVEKLEHEISGGEALGKVHDWLDQPQRTVPVGSDGDAIANGESEGRKSLTRLGWEFKTDGNWHAPTSLGELTPMYADEVLFGDVDAMETEDEKKYARQTRGIFAGGYRGVYLKTLKSAAQLAGSGGWGAAMALLTEDERKALSEGIDTAGGFLVPPDAQAEILSRTAAASVMRQVARVVPTSRDKITWPRVQAHASEGSIYSSGFVGSWTGETPAFTDTDPAFGTFEIAIRKARAATRLSNDFVSDSAANILAFLSVNGSENLALVEDNGFINGDGASLEPSGLLIGGATEVDVEGSVANTISNAIDDVGSAPKIINLEYALPEQYLANARWLLRRANEGNIRQLVDADGRFMWGGIGLNAGNRDEIDGYPLTRSVWMPDDGVADNQVLVFGDLSSYIIAQRAQITTRVLNERFADTDQVGIILFSRVGGALENEDAIRIGIV